ncbi:MAG: excalibur calcium-binding domain-containing protein [Longimicrobiaceae bacterium]
MIKPLLVGLGLLTLVSASTSGQRRSACDASYPDFCIPPPPPDLDCKDVSGKKPFRVRRPDPHHFDRDRDGWACEPRPTRH